MRIGNAVSLQKNRDFRRIYGKGRCFVHPALVTYCTKGRQGRFRIGITAAKKVGGAVQRNRARRVIREAYRTLSPQLVGCWDFVFVARAKTASLKSTEIASILGQHLVKAGALAHPGQMSS